MVAKFAAAPSAEGNTPVSEISRGAQRVVRDLIMVILPSSTCRSFPAPPLPPKLASDDLASKSGVARSTGAFLPIAPSSLPHRRRPTNPFFLPPDEKIPQDEFGADSTSLCRKARNWDPAAHIPLRGGHSARLVCGVPEILPPAQPVPGAM